MNKVHWYNVWFGADHTMWVNAVIAAVVIGAGSYIAVLGLMAGGYR